MLSDTTPNDPRRNVYLFQPGVSHGRGRFVGYYLPYSVGCLWSYAAQHAHIREKYRLADIVFRRERPAHVMGRLDRPRVAAFSAYIWNWKWNLRVARMIKEQYPDCLVVFGGPQVPEHQNHTLFVEYPFIDIASHAEGEVTFLEVLERVLDGRSL
jgi:putative methyltransferase